MTTRGRRRVTGTVRIGPRQTPAHIRGALLEALVTGPVRVEGGDCQELQRLLTVAGIEGLEVRDEAGYLVAAAQRLRLAYGEVSERKRLPLRWSVEVLRSHAEVPDETGYVVERHRSNEAGRRILFRPGTLLYLWHCDVL